MHNAPQYIQKAVKMHLSITTSIYINKAVNKWSYLPSVVIKKHATLTELKVPDKYSLWLTKEFKALDRTRDKLKNIAIKKILQFEWPHTDTCVTESIISTKI